MPCWYFLGSVLAYTTSTSASGPFVIHILLPLSIKWSPDINPPCEVLLLKGTFYLLISYIILCHILRLLTSSSYYKTCSYNMLLYIIKYCNCQFLPSMFVPVYIKLFMKQVINFCIR